MRFDAKNWGELDRAVQNYGAAMSSEPFVLVLHTPGQITYRFIVNQHGIVRQECDVRGDATHDL